MAQITSGLRSILSLPVIYNIFQSLAGARKSRALFAADYIRAKSGDCILDIGCGTAQILKYLPFVRYYGFDSSKEYIKEAEKMYGYRAKFNCKDINLKNLEGLPRFDIVLAMGVLHHLNDDEALCLLKLAKSALKTGGRLVTIDPCYIEGQSTIAHFIISRDRGQNVRSDNDYKSLVEPIFKTTKCYIRHDLSRIPYTHIILECII